MDQEQNIPAPEVQPTPSQNPFPQPMKTQESGTGPIVGGIIILVLVIVAAWYFLAGSGPNDPMTLPLVTTESAGNEDVAVVGQPDATTETLNAQGTTDDISSIEADLNQTDLDAAGVDIDNI
ncbi:MAG: hypothetical protein UY81_C0033G0002 [Candidatus Giovannonibacteria bacterium GW2011_GWA2_53_7]|uniref:Uncharacterized protein n=1 Tax=Candidatus Giovannonibacteria bacterium GW2011_GWA2_53_7 TaxID=1618650 RepID=A0A0G1XYW4_9BACT|nr:MAG: hypothetical protein UY81_C0033G0002 [Candidatus Giovannonibacteria bacterium GW2011_GWA2_53_7]